MSNVNITIDTEEMARSIHSVSGNVRQVGENVIESGNRIVNAEALAAEEISQNISQGFYFLMQNQIRQKLSKLYAEIQSRILQMGHEKAAALGIRKQFFNDYNMIKKRYHKLFTELDRNLKQRIAEIDSAVFELIDEDFRTHIEKRHLKSASAMVYTEENPSAADNILEEHTENMIMKLIRHLKVFFEKNTTYKKQINSIKIRNVKPTAREMCVPYLMMETDDFVTGTVSNKYYFAGEFQNGESNNRAVSQFFSNMDTAILEVDNSNYKWKSPTAKELENVNNEFNKLLTRKEYAPEKEKRLKDTIKALYDQSRWEIIDEVVK